MFSQRYAKSARPERIVITAALVLDDSMMIPANVPIQSSKVLRRYFSRCSFLHSGCSPAFS
jgi:hypothetical protein